MAFIAICWKGKSFTPVNNSVAKEGLKKEERSAKFNKINKLFGEGHKITYYTARGSVTGINWYDITKEQLDKWGCKYHELSVGEKPDYDLMICDKTKRIEEIS